MKKKYFKRKTLLPLLITLLIGAFVVGISLPSIFQGTEPNEEPTPPNSDNEMDNDQIKIVNKQIPSGYVMGNSIDIKLMSGIGALHIETPEERVSIRFTAQLSGAVSVLAIHTLSPKGQPQVRVGLQEDSAGAPNGEWMNEYGFGISEILSNSSFITVSLQRTVTLSKGGVYHIVIETVEFNVGDEIPIRTYVANSLAQPLNDEDPDIVWPDPMINTLFYSEEEWREENKWPIFIVGYSDGRYEGQPYSLEAPWVICSAKYVGQTIIPASEYTIGRIAFVVSVKGEPSDELYYEIRDSSNDVLASGLFTEASQLSIRMAWIEVTLPSPVTFHAGKLYRIVLLSPGTDLKNPYHVYGHEFSYGSSIGYGGLQHQLTSSHNAGSTWFENQDADAVFKLTNTE